MATDRRSFLGLRVAAVLAILGGLGGAGWWHVRQLLPAVDAATRGAMLGGEVVHDGEPSANAVKRHTQRLLDRPLQLQVGGETVLTASLRELGASMDEERLQASLASIGRGGDLWQRLDNAREAAHGRRSIALPIDLPAEVLINKLAHFKARYDRPPQAARWDFEKDAPSDHKDGLVLDMYASLEAILAAARSDQDKVALVVAKTRPAATREAVAKIDRSKIVHSYETRFAYLGNKRGRAQNVTRAAEGLDGLVLMPGEVMSFNDRVGPRSIDNGFAKAGEIYKGEMRMGIGGGTCQVASTFHAAAFLAGLEVVQRSPHSRPSGYIGPGLDATVAYPHVDLKMRNPFPFAIVVRAVTHKGTLRLDLLGAEQPATVELTTATVGVQRYKRKIREAHWLEPGRVIRKQKGIRGLTVEKIRRIRYSDGSTKTEKTTDRYPPTTEVYYVSPGTDVETALPPLPSDV